MAAQRKPHPKPTAETGPASGTEAPRPKARELGRDGVTVMVNRDRALRARELDQPARQEGPARRAASLIDRIEGRITNSKGEDFGA